MGKYFLYTILTIQLFSCKKKEANNVTQKNNSKETINKNGISQQIDTIRGYFDSDKIVDYIKIINKSHDEKTVKIFLGRKKHDFSEVKAFSITNDDFMEVSDPLENIFISKGAPGEIIIGASCCGNFKTTETYTYKFIKDNWFLYKTSISTVEDDFIPTIQLKMNDLSYTVDGKTINNQSIYKNEVEKLKQNAILSFSTYLNLLEMHYKDKTLNKMESMGCEDIAEIIYFNAINENNINDYNDFAYYTSFTKNGNIVSILLLKEIINTFPDRVVAYLNLADAYWAINNIEKAKEFYQKYIDLMKSQKKDISKIPQRAYARIK